MKEVSIVINKKVRFQLMEASKANTTTRISQNDLDVLRSMIKNYNLNTSSNGNVTSLKSVIHGIIDYVLSTTTEQDRYDIINKYATVHNRDIEIDQTLEDIAMSMCHITRVDFEKIQAFDEQGHRLFSNIVRLTSALYDPNKSYDSNINNILEKFADAKSANQITKLVTENTKLKSINAKLEGEINQNSQLVSAFDNDYSSSSLSNHQEVSSSVENLSKLPNIDDNIYQIAANMYNWPYEKRKKLTKMLEDMNRSERKAMKQEQNDD